MPDPENATAWFVEHGQPYIEVQIAKLQDEIDRRVTTILREMVTQDHSFLDQINALRREATINFDASHLATDKAEQAAEKRFENLNEWRQQSLDRERAFAEARLRLEAQFLREEVFDAWKETVEARFVAAAEQASLEAGARVTYSRALFYGFQALAVIVAIATAIIILTRHG